MSRLNTYIPFYEDFTKKLKLSLHEFGIKHNITYSKYFSNKLGFRGDNAKNQFLNYLNQNGKNFTFRELIFLIEQLGQDSKPILDYLAAKTGFVVFEKIDSKSTIEDLQHILLKFPIHQGIINVTYLNAIKDLELDEDEISKLKEQSYQFRCLLSQFEYQLIELEKRSKR